MHEGDPTQGPGILDRMGEGGISPDMVGPEFVRLQALQELGLPEKADVVPYSVGRWGKDASTGLLLALGAGVASSGTRSGDPSSSDGGGNDSTQSVRRPDGIVSRRGFLGLVATASAAAALAACTSPAQRTQASAPVPEGGNPPVPPGPTPTIEIKTGAVASLEKDFDTSDETELLNSIRQHFSQQLDALRAQFPQERIPSMRLSVNTTELLENGKHGLSIELTEIEGKRKYAYFGYDTNGQGGAWVSLPQDVTYYTDPDGNYYSDRFDSTSTRWQPIFQDNDGNIFRNRLGMLVGLGSNEIKLGITENSAATSQFLTRVGARLHDFVRDEVFLQGGNSQRIYDERANNATFLMKVKYDTRLKQLYGVIERTRIWNGQETREIFIVRQDGQFFQIKPLAKGPGGEEYGYRLNRQSGLIEVVRNGEQQGEVKDFDNTGEARTNIAGVSTIQQQEELPTPPPQPNTPEPTATIQVVLQATAVPTATVEPIKTPEPEIDPHPYSVVRTIDYGSLDSSLFNNGIEQQGYYVSSPPFQNEQSFAEIIDDPTGQFGGKVVHAVIKGPPPPHDTKKWGPAHRDYYGFDPADLEQNGSYAVEFDHLVVPTKQVLKATGNGPDAWNSVISLGVVDKNQGGWPYRVVAGVDLVTVGPYPHLRPYAVYPDGISRIVDFKDGQPEFHFGIKTKIRVELVDMGDSQRVYIFQDGVFVGETRLRLPPGVKLSQGNIRTPGGYAGAAVTDLESYSGEVKILS
ncbi:twin-arginine translocation signal domain-containing protein [Candidatus Gottesmanbacteria bacterium]|nr:twin-arginine translocation signal domain-containing protein [Candidatus Gottesmanbacteria bacterium]